jgi:hypothetical protein
MHTPADIVLTPPQKELFNLIVAGPSSGALRLRDAKCSRLTPVREGFNAPSTQEAYLFQ